MNLGCACLGDPDLRWSSAECVFQMET